MLLCDNNRAEAHELLQMAVESVRTLLDDIAAAQERDDVAATKHALHDLKGITGNVGASELAKLSETFDDRVRSGGAITASDLADLHAALERLGKVAGELGL